MANNPFADAWSGMQDNWKQAQSFNLGHFLFGAPGHTPGYLGGEKIPNPIEQLNAGLPDIETQRGLTRQMLRGLGPKSFSGTGTSAEMFDAMINSATDASQLLPIMSSIQGLHTASEGKMRGEEFASSLDRAAEQPFFKSAQDISAGGGADLIKATTDQMWEANTNALKALRQNLGGRGIGGGNFQAQQELEMNRKTGIDVAGAAAEIPLKIQQYLAPAINLQTQLQSQAGAVRAGEPIANVDFNGILQQLGQQAETVAGVGQYGQAMQQASVQNLFNALMSMAGLGVQSLPALGTMFNMGGYKTPQAQQPSQTGAILQGIGALNPFSFSKAL